VKKNLIAFSIDTIEKAEQIILETEIYSIKPVLYFKNYIVKGFGSDFILTFKDLLYSKFGKSRFKLYVDCGFDNSLSIKMVTNKIEYIKLKGNPAVLSKINNIANKNRVLLNPYFNIVDCRNRKNIKLKLKKIYSEGKK
jgi:hypothetical protein